MDPQCLQNKAWKQKQRKEEKGYEIVNGCENDAIRDGFHVLKLAIVESSGTSGAGAGAAIVEIANTNPMAKIEAKLLRKTIL